MKMTKDSPEANTFEGAMLLALEDTPIFPCWPDKTPAIENGFYKATTDSKIISKWFSREKFLIGMPCDGLIVVDLDKHNPEADGVANWKQLASEKDRTGDSWRNTRMSRTATGGIHIWFKDPTYPDKPHRNTAGKIAPGVDTRSQGGYVILPPSRTPNGKYEWISQPGAQIYDAPDWLLEILDARPESKFKRSGPYEGPANVTGYAEKALKNELEDLRKAISGTRNHTLNKAAFSLGQLVGAGLLDEMRVINELGMVAHEIGLDDFEIDRTIQSGMSAGMQQPREVKK